MPFYVPQSRHRWTTEGQGVCSGSISRIPANRRIQEYDFFSQGLTEDVSSPGSLRTPREPWRRYFGNNV